MSNAGKTAAYRGRESATTRNPHTAVVPAASQFKQWAKLSTEERVISQWRTSFGCPVSDEAKAQFCINALGRTFKLSDVRLWQTHHQQTPAGKEVQERGTVYLEFFFDGSTSELSGNEETFNKAFEAMIEQQLQEKRVFEFKKKLAARRRGKDTTECDDSAPAGMSESDWRQYLHKPIPATDFSIRSFREAGCMLTFLVCQTSLSIGAAEVLGQISFQEHFPIDGMAQPESTSTKPLPKWVYGMAVCTAGVTFLAITAWWQVVSQLNWFGPTIRQETLTSGL